jgi:hypothetical protein
MSDAGLHWPDAWDIEDVSGSLMLSNRRIEVRDLVGRIGTMSVAADGSVELGADQASTFQLAFRNVVLDRSLLDIIGAQPGSAARRWWSRLQPWGTLDATLDYHIGERSGEPVALTLEPRSLALTAAGEPVEVSVLGGSITARAGQLAFDGLEIGLSTGDRHHGRMTLDGGYQAPGDGAAERWHLSGRWHGGQFRCPLILEALKLLGGEAGLAHVRRLQPDGTFDADIEARFDETLSKPQYEVSLQPHTISLRLDGGTVVTQVDEDSRVTIEPGRVRLEHVAGEHAGGRFQVSGEVDLEPELDADLHIAAAGRLMSPSFQAVLPQGVGAALAAIDFQDGETTELRDGRLRLHWDGDHRAWRSSFSGQVLTHGASFQAGIEFEEVHGRFDITAHRKPDRPWELEMRVRADHARTLGHPLINTEAGIVLDHAHQQVRVIDLRGDLHGGAASAQASIGIGENLDYDLTVNLVGVQLEPILAAEPKEPRNASGQLFAGVSLSGARGEPGQRRGRGMMFALRGRVAEVPLILQILKIPQLTLPISGIIDYADADFFIVGEQLTFERLLFESTLGDNVQLQLLGEGGMDLDDFTINARFRSRGGVLLVRDLMGGLGDQLYMIEVTGPLNDPRATIVPLPALSPPRYSQQPVDAAIAVSGGSS